MKAQEVSSEEWSEIGDHVVNKISKTLERFEQRFTLDNPRFAERYLKAELHFLIFFRIGSIDEEFIAYFQREHPVTGFEKGVERFHFGEGRNKLGQFFKGVSAQV